MPRNGFFAAALASLACAASVASAAPGTVAPRDDVAAPPPTYKANGVTVDEHLGAKLPLDAKFRTQTGAHVVLGDVIKGEIPTILTFNYSDCPMLCSIQLNALASVLPVLAKVDGDQAHLRVGAQFRIVTIDLEPTESLEKLQKMKDRYIERLPAELRAQAREGWTFLVADTAGDGAQIKRVADAVGFHYAYVPERAEWAHPAALIFASAAGVVTRYVYGIVYEAQVMRESIIRAGLAEPSTAIGFMCRCYEYDPGANSHAHAGVVALRIGAAVVILLLLSAFAMLRAVRRSSRASQLPLREHL